MFGGVYLKFSFATEFIYYNIRFRLRIFSQLQPEEWQKNYFIMKLLPDTGSNLRPNDYKPNTKPLSYRTNDENSRSNSLLTFKCELFIQMTEQSYSLLFTLTVGFILKDLFVILIINLCL